MRGCCGARVRAGNGKWRVKNRRAASSKSEFGGDGFTPGLQLVEQHLFRAGWVLGAQSFDGAAVILQGDRGALDSAREFVVNESAPAIALGSIQPIRPVARAVTKKQFRVPRVIERYRFQHLGRGTTHGLATTLVARRRKPRVQHALRVRTP